MISTKDSWIVARCYITCEGNVFIRNVNIMKSEISSIGESAKSGTIILLKGGDELNLCEDYADFVIDFFTTEEQVINQ